MSYCRFSDGDVYLYFDVGGYICCCACWLAPKVNTIFTKGEKSLLGTSLEGPCKKCDGVGCDACQMHGNLEFFSYSDAIEHLEEHKGAGHEVPQYAFDMLLSEQEKGGYGFRDES